MRRSGDEVIATATRFGWCALLALSACYSPNAVGGAPCDPASPSCPSGQSCLPIGGGHYCTTTTVDAGSGSDGTPPDGSFCLGAGFGQVCLPAAPTGAVTLATAVTINTASVGGTNCTEIRPQRTGGGSVCLIAGGTLQVATTATVRAIGPNPLVLFAAQTITIAGTLDVSSHFGETIGGTPVSGAGARTAADCNAIGVDGAISNNSLDGGGGGAGGSFGTLGGLGGNGRRGTLHGSPAATPPPTSLVGGCPGGHGGDGEGGGGGGVGGSAGGAVYLVAGDSITVAGKLSASGAGGAAGTGGANSGGAAGGGGAGGMIALDAPSVTVTGSVFANGGGGGGGNGNDFDRNGQRGGEPTIATAAANGGPGGANGGGPGGAGSVGAMVGKNGGNGGNDFCAGGGGGGGAGVIRIFGVPASSVTGTISPPAS